MSAILKLSGVSKRFGSLLANDNLSMHLNEEIYAQLERITANGTTLIVVEQDIKQAMAVSDRVYCVREGRVVLEGRPPDLGRDEITKAYFGM
jgi:branched-chain amino acid transport system ATP-binding protein